LEGQDLAPLGTVPEFFGIDWEKQREA